MRHRCIMIGLVLLVSACGEPERERSKTAKIEPAAVTDDNFENAVLQSKQPVLVDFWAPWCGPCLQLAPIVEDLAGEFAGRVKVVKLDVDAAPQTAARYSIRSIPRLMLFKDGKVLSVRQGMPPGDAKFALTQWLSESLE